MSLGRTISTGATPDRGTRSATLLGTIQGVYNPGKGRTPCLKSLSLKP